MEAGSPLPCMREQYIIVADWLNEWTRNTLDCQQSNYSSRIPIEFGQTGISAIRSADLENPTVEPNV